MNKFIAFCLIQLVWINYTSAQSLDFLRSTGKIYSVVAVILVIFLGIVIFLFRLDNKLTKLENQIKNEQ
jgi:CcmD family protein